MAGKLRRIQPVRCDQIFNRFPALILTEFIESSDGSKRTSVMVTYFKGTRDQLFDYFERGREFRGNTAWETFREQLNSLIKNKGEPYLSCPAVSHICNLIFFPPKTIMKRKFDQENSPIDRFNAKEMHYGINER